MSHSLFDSDVPHPEPSNLTAFAANDLNRDSEHRDEGSVEKALARDGTHIFAFAKDKLVLKHDGQVLDPLFARYELQELKPNWDEIVLLGYRKTGEPRLAVPVGIDVEDMASQYKPVDGRSLFRDELVDEMLLGEFSQAASLIRWNGDNQFCGRCGSVMEIRIGGYKRVCTACEHMIFPRTDPVVIMLTIDEERDLCLLGRSPHFAPGMYSCLAGFLEPGETIEDAARREVLEESGIQVGSINYVASQPWPYPSSLMIGLIGEALNRDIVIDKTELEDARWFARNEILQMLDERHPQGFSVPPRMAIAHRILEQGL